MTEPLHLTFDVACGAPHAFEVWTAEIARWWPADHSMSGGPERVVLTKGPDPFGWDPHVVELSDVRGSNKRTMVGVTGFEPVTSAV